MGGDVSAEPLPGLLEAVLVQAETSQLLLHFPDQKEVGRGKVQSIGDLFKVLDGVGGKPIRLYGGSMLRRIVLVKKPLLGRG